MSPLRLASAPGLLLSASPGETPRVTDEAVGVALLDLRQESPSVALCKLSAIAAGLAPRFFLQEGLRLLVSAGDLPVARAAEAIAGALAPSAAGSGAIATVRGENLLGRLEELMQAGCDLRRLADGRRLADERRAPLAAWAPCPAGPVAAALGAGAVVVVTQQATPQTLAHAAACDAFGWPAGSSAGGTPAIDDAMANPGSVVEIDPASVPVRIPTDGGPPGDAPVELWFADRQELRAIVEWPATVEPPASGAEAFERACRDMTTEGVTVSLNRAGEVGVVTVGSDLGADPRPTATRIALLTNAAGGGPRLVRPFEETPEICREQWRTTVPRDRLRFGYDCRPAADWLT